MPSTPPPRPRARAPGQSPAAEGAPQEETPAPFPIVGVGASAGGLEAFRQLLAHVPPDAGLALVLVQHLEPTRTSLLTDALAQATSMKVSQAGQGDRVEPNHVYVIPPGTQLAIEHGVLQLSPLDPDERRPHLPIDFFLGSLAVERGRRAIGVILSGTASDGTAGLAAIRAHGGITFAQDPRTARFAEMPQSAVDAGVVDFCLPLPALGAELRRLANHPYLARGEVVPPTPAGVAVLARILDVIREATGSDLSEHKPATLRRRLSRRLVVRQSPSLAAYLELLQKDPAEVQVLFDDLLIKVTSFFRDEESFEELKAIAFPALLHDKAPGASIRAWVVGCSTGEEVYSLAITFLEHLAGGPHSHPVLIFGSDLSEKSLVTARAGYYPDAAVQGLSEERLRRFFVRTERGWRVAQAVRDLCVFVRHDVARDPPFSRLDLVSCRNVLIYFSSALQRRVLAAAHYCLLTPGYLLLGRSESAAAAPRWFAPAARASRLYVRKPGPSAFHLLPRLGALPGANAPAGPELRAPALESDLARQVDRLLLARYGPPGVVVDEHLQVLEYRGRTGPYLEQPAGEPQTGLLKLARGGLAAPLRIALAQARTSAGPVRKEHVAVDGKDGEPPCDLVILPVTSRGRGEPSFVVLFEARPPPPPAPHGPKPKGGRVSATTVDALEQKLASTKEYVALLLEEHGRGTEALASTNDELVSGNEELQSLNEELETAKEELQASNEELTTVNDELNGRNQELLAVNADVLHLLEAIELPVLMLDDGCRIRRFTQRAAEYLGLTPADMGRRIFDVSLPVHVPDLAPWIIRAMDEVVMIESEIQDADDRWHRLRVRPNQAVDGHVQGVVLSLVDIDALRHEIERTRWARDYARSIVEAVQVPLLVLDAGLVVLSANAACYQLLGEAPDELEGRGLFELRSGEWDTTALRAAVSGIAARPGPAGRFQGLALERDSPGLGRRHASVSGCAVPMPAGAPLILLAIEDVTERRETERLRAEALAAAEAARQLAERADRTKDVFLAHLSHELRAPLTAIMLHAGGLRRGQVEAEAVARAGALIEAAIRRQARLVDDLLDVSRIAAGKLTLAVAPLDLRALVAGSVETMRPEAAAKGVQVTFEGGGEDAWCPGDRVRLEQVVSNLLANAVKFTPAGGTVQVRIGVVDGMARLAVADSGRGIEAELLPRIFERFVQGPDVEASGLGIGLFIVRDLVALHGGTVAAESPGKDLGATFTVRLPLGAAPGPAPA